MLNIVLVGVGGFAGSVMRYLTGVWVQQWLSEALFPFGTLLVNCIGCFVIGLVTHIAETKGMFVHEGRLFMVVGFLGGFTTFSSFGHETLVLIRDNHMAHAFANVSAHLFLGLLAVWLGWRVIALHGN
ncbi:MAG: fluoride efflux transporter CrcB [Candidatus Hydrogenedentes bacterium]|jgi:CrcB protein|nr:fluoride efflux transporter CrcB [Candidatus Hydrogenedentota bacterium]